MATSGKEMENIGIVPRNILPPSQQFCPIGTRRRSNPPSLTSKHDFDIPSKRPFGEGHLSGGEWSADKFIRYTETYNIFANFHCRPMANLSLGTNF